MQGDKKTVMLVQHVAAEGLGLFAPVLLSMGVAVRRVALYAGEPVPRSTEGCDALIVMGGPQAVYETNRYPQLREELKLIELALHSNLPLLGVCLGCQLLCTALGATVSRGKQREIGWHELVLSRAVEHDDFFSRFPRRFMAFHWHGDQCELPAYATLLASSERTPVQAFSYGVNALGIQYHPEVDAQCVATFCREFAAELAEENLSADELNAAAALHLPGREAMAQSGFASWLSAVWSAAPITLESGFLPGDFA